MSDVKRYSMRRMGMNLLPDGDYVLYSDYAALEARLAEVEAERELDRRAWKMTFERADEAEARAERAEVEVARLTERLTKVEKLKHDVVGDKISLVAELRQTKAELRKD